ncbi:MAG: family 43 glycosylhydrolase [Polyangiaceae bacterium]|nr:family 43 glycosylhydrolase [Polyangiaceae bacterium]MCE7892434.1 hypothetical protein [Sorangiineae bacterium PRO1]MCL4752394.1 family 43 glycosylhydrolase [Myxococcales bacterium]
MSRSCLLLALGVLACGADERGPGEVGSPHRLIELPTDGDVADPHVIQVGGTWYLYATNAPDELRVWHSDDLETWTFGGAVWKPTPGSWNAGQGVWAPHVQLAPDGSFYLYITANLRIGVAKASSPLGPFVDVFEHPLVGDGYGHVGNGALGEKPLDFDERAIDAFVLDDAGELTLFFSAYDPTSKIYATPMLDYTTLDDVAPKLVLAPSEGWEGLIVEGAWVEQHAGRYHLMYSGNIYMSTSYAIGVAESDAPLGPYQRYPNNPILKTDEALELYAPGHNSVSTGRDGARAIFYHTKRAPEVGADRRLRYAPLGFGADGRVVVPEP